MTSLPKRPNSKTKKIFNKWLPAIVLAIFIHILLLALFLNNYNKSDPVSNSEPKSDKIDLQNLNTSNPKQVKTISKNNTSDIKDDELILGNDSNNNLNQETLKIETSKKDNDENSLGSKNQSLPINTNNKKHDLGNQSVQDNINKVSNKQPNDYPPVNNTNYVLTPQVNPNDQVLLPRDLPKSEHNVLVHDDDYSSTAEQSENLSDQLSTIVNEVKEQKLQQIEAQQNASREAYLANRGVSPELSSTSDSLKTEGTENGAETEKSVPNPPNSADAP